MDYADQIGAARLRAAQLEGMGLQQQVGRFEFEQAQDAARRNALERAAYASAVGAGGSEDDLLRRLEQSGMPGLGKMAQDRRKATLDAQKTKAGIAKDEAATDSERRKQFITEFAMMPDAQSVAASLSQAVQKGQLPMQAAQGLLAQLQQAQDPAQFAQWKHAFLMRLASPEAQLGAETTRRGQDTSAATARETAAMTDARVRAEGAANRAVTMRGQNMTDARTRERLVTDKEAAAERRAAERTESGVNKYAATLQKEGLPELDAAVGAAEAELAKYKPGSAPGVGVGTGAVPEMLLSSEGKKLRQAVASVRNIVLNARSGAAVTDQELRRMVEELGSSGLSTEEALRNGLAAVRDRLEAIKANAAAGVGDDVKDAYEARGGLKIQRGGKKPEAAPTGAPKPGTVEGGYRFKGGNPADPKSWEKV